MEKLRNMAKWLDRIMGLCYRMSILSIVLSTLLALFELWIALGAPELISKAFAASLDFGMIRFTLAEPMEGLNGLIGFGAAFVLHIIHTTIYCMTFYTVRGILEPIREGIPFHDNIVICLRKLGWLTLASGILGNVSDLVSRGNLLLGYDLEALFISEKISQVAVNYSFDLTFLIYAAVLFLLAYIFQYGGELQQLSDETL